MLSDSEIDKLILELEAEATVLKDERLLATSKLLQRSLEALQQLTRTEDDYLMDKNFNEAPSIQSEKPKIEIILTHLVNKGSTKTACCDRLTLELPRDHRLTPDPWLKSCTGGSQ